MSKRGEIFRSVEMQRLPSNTFDLSYDHKLSLKMGKLIPIHVGECLPGDKFNFSCTSMLRMAPMIAPVMHQVKVHTHFFFVPNRLVWDGWEDFITGGEYNSTPPAFPYLNFETAVNPSTLYDYLGLPTGVTGGIGQVSAIPFSAYQMVYNDYYRDQNLQPEVDFQLANGSNNANYANLAALRVRAWQHDYFTSALPWAQKGEPVDVPLAGGTAPIKINTFGTAFTAEAGYFTDGNYYPSTSVSQAGLLAENTGSVNPAPGLLYADLGAATAGITVNELRNSIALQTWLETNARGGTRYFESMQAHFNVRTPDARLQRPEYIGGTLNPMVISEVLQTSSTDAETPQGNMSGHGISVGSGGNLSYYCPEHGYIIGIMSIMPVTAYQQGIPKHYSKFDPYDYFWKEFASIGEQPILNKELYVTNDGLNDEVFGYTPRYAEYRYNPSIVSGDFQTSLNFWHMGRIFTSRPTLNSTFITADPTTRIFAVTEDIDNIYAHVYHQINARRLMPRFGVPSFTF